MNIVEGRGQRVEETKIAIAGEPDGKGNLAARHLSRQIQVQTGKTVIDNDRDFSLTEQLVQIAVGKLLQSSGNRKNTS